MCHFSSGKGLGPLRESCKVGHWLGPRSAPTMLPFLHSSPKLRCAGRKILVSCHHVCQLHAGLHETLKPEIGTSAVSLTTVCHDIKLGLMS